MKKSRLEAFTDAIIAIIVTIMVLEIKAPAGGQLKNLFTEWHTFFAYAVTFFLICTTWYNHHYLINQAKWISKRSFWLNCLWLFAMSFFPVATNWVGRFPQATAPEYFYIFVYAFWGIAFYFLTASLAQDNPSNAHQIRLMLKGPFGILEFGIIILAVVAISLFPFAGLLLSLLDGIIWSINTPKDSDRFES
ncbi:TMEM175 family protein [uncultured Limosilactobacillus sp.]|uniref:TMEM175 family protein n=1 Tax=uncultured Limosilactobacillus sp. TaxID=2837629 RepID=UPI0025E50A0E|nr:TMEM175 family protein [uncultured Limosilactobacillus sp.]